uniref:Uracil phosphoribosyltransferase n=1 Tax=Gracilaria salicornia TaxID=172968 RepID=W8DW91_9FLOR|nr:uracil phosphoribosyltransferase [Gracilaria salicornia]AHH24520.1 uracil phosphoribosyltransferase [Gracilaria salicornia]UAD87708.1 hypothetical protein [Gracilaria salicornia]
MKLNIHTLMHPSIQKLAYEIIYQKSHKQLQNTDNEKILGMLIFYETLRKWLKIDNIYIKKVDILKESYLLNHLDKYLIITNIIKCYNILADVHKILPQSYLQHIDFDSVNNIFDYNERLQEYKIIIFEKFLKNYTIIELINYLHKNNKINLNHVKIICITSNSNILKYIAQKYPQLNIYTIKII